MTLAEPHALLGGRLKLLQAPTGHRVGTDAVLLVAAAPPLERGLIIDLGAGVGAVGLMAALTRPSCDVQLIDNDPDALALAERNIALNNLGGRVSMIESDILEPLDRGGRLAPGVASLVLTNPPYGAKARMRVSPDQRRAAAHIMPQDGLAAWLAFAADLLKPRGALVMIHRADALAAALAALARQFGAITIRPVLPRADKPATRILVRATKGSRGPLSILPPLILHGSDGRFTADVDAIHRGEAAISFDNRI